jgi:pyruvate formate lyase activating enzyme
MQGHVFNIQRFSIHDGPGIRTSVFLKGCNLRCLWCHNPESRSPQQEIQYFPQKCVLCHKCIDTCPEGAHFIDAQGVKLFDRSKCNLCGICVDNCMYDALVYVYKSMEPEEVVEEVLKDLDYYHNSGGGLTISGGEPMLQKEFIKAVFDQAKAYGIHNALDTAANIPWEDLEYILPSIDLVLLDLKVVDEEMHIKGTGVSNRRILQNAIKLSQQDVDVIVRIPVVPGINATGENMRATAEFLKDFPRLKYVELLPYHDLGVDKYNSLGQPTQATLFNVPAPEEIIHLSQSFKAANIPVKVG